MQFPSSPYCARGRKRQLHVSELLTSDMKFGQINVQVHNSGHFFDTMNPKDKSNKASQIARVSVNFAM